MKYKLKLVERLLKLSEGENYNSDLEKIISIKKSPEDIINSLFDLYLDRFEDSDTVSEFETQKNLFISDYKNDLSSMITMLNNGEIKIKNISDFLLSKIKEYLPFN